jgi:EamA domain-containing membrane protein RarD
MRNATHGHRLQEDRYRAVLGGHQVNRPDQHGPRYGILYGIAAYGLWGLLPLYFKAVAQVAPVEVLAHRALWSFVVLAVLVHLLGR